MGVRDRGHDRQSETVAVGFACAARLQTLEGLEKPRDLVGGYAGPGICHGQPRALLNVLDNDVDPPSRHVVLERILDEVEERLSHFARDPTNHRAGRQ